MDLEDLFIFALVALAVHSMDVSAKTINCVYDDKEITMNVDSKDRKVDITTFEGKNKKNIYINDINNFSQLEDFVTLENDLGHKITYFLSCK